MRKAIRHRDPTLPYESDIFQSKPIQIKALLKAMKWTRFEMGRYCGVYTRIQKRDGKKLRTSWAVSTWTLGRAKPSKPHRQRLCQLVEMCRKEYLAILKEMIRSERLKDV